MSLSIVILAAGSGKRMRSGVPKVLHQLAGKPMLEHVVNTAEQLNPEEIFVVYGNGGDLVPTAMQHLPIKWVLQETPKGTGHAVLQALPQVNQQHQVLVLYGDVPLISLATLQRLIDNTPKNAVGLVVAEFNNPTGFGRIIRNDMGNIVAIIEEKDTNEQQKKIREINTGILTTSAKHLGEWLPKLTNHNNQGEFYLTDIIAMAEQDGISVGGVFAECREEVSGVNNLRELATLERYYQLQQANHFLLNGTTFADPTRFDLRGCLTVGRDVVIDINVVIEGNVTLGDQVKIGPNCYLRDVSIGNDVEINANSVIEEAVIENNCVVGPFARIRPGTYLHAKVKVGNFVEVKKSVLGVGSKANHLSYLGDAVIGRDVNIGAGTITCNYDGVNKFTTTIEDGAFIGSDTQLIAPVVVGKNATIGAGSTITQNAPAEQLTVARSRQKSVASWRRPNKKEAEEN